MVGIKMGKIKNISLLTLLASLFLTSNVLAQDQDLNAAQNLLLAAAEAMGGLDEMQSEHCSYTATVRKLMALVVAM